MKTLSYRKQKLLQVSMLVGLSVVALFGCGARNTPVADGSATLASTEPTAGPAADCNQFSSSDFSFKLMAYKDPFNGKINPSFIRMKILSLPADFASAGDIIRIYSWTANAAGNTSINNIRPYAQFEKYNSGLFSNSADQYGDNWNNNYGIGYPEMKDIIAAQNGQTISDLQSFIDQYTLKLNIQDSANDWKAFRVEITDANTLVAKRVVNVLIPHFDADPNLYVKNHAKVLNDLHPFISELGQVWTSTYFETKSKPFCF